MSIEKAAAARQDGRRATFLRLKMTGRLGADPANQRAAAFYQKHGLRFLDQWEALESHPHIKVQKWSGLRVENLPR